MNNTNRSKAIIYALALLVFGGVIGAMIRSSLAPVPQTLRLGRVDEIAAFIRDRLDSKLDLTPEQRQRIEPLILKAAQEMEASHLDCLKRVNKAADDLHAQIQQELIPEQQQKLVDLETDRAQRMWDKYHYQTMTNASRH